jgi:hypothetical protein
MFLTTAAGTQNHALPRSDALTSYGTGRACYPDFPLPSWSVSRIRLYVGCSQ